jgi:hypothetical protein
VKAEFVILGLWCIAIVATLLIVDGTEAFTYLGPLYAICAIGSVWTVRSLRKTSASGA